MKKGITLIEWMVVFVMIGIFAACAIPKFIGLECKEKLDHCKEVHPNTYTQICENNEKRSTVDVKISEHCYGKKQSKVNEVIKEVPTIIHDTIRVVDTVYLDYSRENCIKNCTENNKSQTVIDFCIKEECK